MTITSKDNHETEGDFEAKIHAVLLKIFPWLDANSISHQKQFRMKFGHGIVTVNGNPVSSKHARLDVLISYKDKPLVVLELKQEDVPLDEDDVKQGLSYARMIETMPPIVVVTNGINTKIFRSYDGEPILGETIEEEYFSEIMSSVGRVASQDLKNAINTLLCGNDDFWKKAVSSSSQIVLRELESGFVEYLRPFVSKFIIKRKITVRVEEILAQGKKMVIVEGPPLSGKSSVLREITLRSLNENNLPVLYIEADSSHQGIFQSIANTLSSSLSWSIGADDVRSWLRNISSSESKIIIAIDGVAVRQDKIRQDIDELVSKTMGPNIQVILTLDDSVTKKWTLVETGRKETAIGRMSEVVTLSSLDDDEFFDALEMLEQHRITFMRGSNYSAEYRIPWILRFAAAEITTNEKYSDEELCAVLPSLLGLDIFRYTQELFSQNENLASSFSSLAKCVIRDASEKDRDISLMLESMSAFVIQNKTLSSLMSRDEVNELESNGYIKRSFSESDNNKIVIIPRLPELLAYSVAYELSLLLVDKIDADAEKAAQWLVRKCCYLPLGDIIGAQAIISAAISANGCSIVFINKMLDMKPEMIEIETGTKTAMHYPGIGTVRLEFSGDGNVIASAKGRPPMRLELDPDEKSHMYNAASHQSWLMLSYISGIRLAILAVNGDKVGDLAPVLLIELASCPLILQRPSTPSLDKLVAAHDVPGYGQIACYSNGIVEPVTLSLMRSLLNWEIDNSTKWIEDAIKRNSLPLFSRIDIALREISKTNEKNKASWAVATRNNVVTPAINNLLELH